MSAVAAGLALLLAGGRAGADTSGATGSRTPSSETTAPKVAASSTADAVAEGEKRLRNMTARVSGIKRIRDHAATGRDATQLSCVQYQDTKAKVVLQLAQEAQQALAQASSGNDAAERSYQASRLAMLDDMLKGVQKTAHLCIDQELSTIQVFKVEVNADSALEAQEPASVLRPTVTADRPPER